MPQTEDGNCWATISGCLVANKCWLCETTFPRGQKRKVFMVSQLLEALQRIEVAIVSTGEPEEPINFKNFRACVESFHAMNGNVDALLGELKKLDLAPWFSGLICGSETCRNEYYIIVPTSRPAASSAVSGGGIAAAAEEQADSIKRSLGKFVSSSPEDCPPGCGCDNPWPFLSGLTVPKKT